MTQRRAIGAWAKQNSEIAVFAVLIAVLFGVVILLGTTQTSQILQVVSKPV